jgi:hypothetical protein
VLNRFKNTVAGPGRSIGTGSSLPAGNHEAGSGEAPMQAARRMPIVRFEMYAREIDDAAMRLRSLRRQAWEQFGVAASAFGVAIAATQAHPPLAIPLLLGGVAVGALGLRTEWLHWDLLDRLAGQPDAHAIPEVLAYANRGATEEPAPVVRRRPRVP